LNAKDRWASLSRREREVARLVAEGLTSREITKKLFIADRTAEGHVEQIRNKCGFQSRREIAGLVADQGSTASTNSQAATRTVMATRSVAPRPPTLHFRKRAVIAAACLLVVALAGWLLVGAGPSRAPPGSYPRITTFAGTGAPFLSPDGLTPANTALIGPAGLYIDPGGDVFASDGDRVRRLVTDGVVSTAAGTNRAGFAGDGGAATAAELWLESGSIWGVMGLTGDAAGNRYIADQQNNRIRMVSTDGRISTFAGGGTSNPGDGGPARDASLGGPRGLVVDSRGDLYVAESDANRVREISTDGTITTVAGTGAPGFAGDGGQVRIDVGS
jgi:DNA-binding CsgD family transcriptional regulator